MAKINLAFVSNLNCSTVAGTEYPPVPILAQSILIFSPVSGSVSIIVKFPATAEPSSSGINPICSLLKPDIASMSSITASLSSCSTNEAAPHAPLDW